MAHLPDAPLSHPLALHAQPADEAGGSASAIVSELFEHAVPAFAVAALDRLYGSMYASLRHLRLCEPAQPLPHTWVGYLRGEIVGVLLFRVEPARVRVLTEMARLDEDRLDAFCRAVFARYPQVSVIVLNAVDVPRLPQRWPGQSYAFSENYVIELPSSVDAYQAQLGRSTRKTLQGYGNRIARELPGLHWECLPASAMPRHAQRQLVRTLQRFKRDSMQARGKQVAIERRDTARLLLLAADCGLFGIARLQGRVVAGSLACRFGDTYVMLLSAADPAYARWRLGFLCCYWSVCDCLRQGGRACHLLWGRYAYKRQLLGQLQALQRVHLYRSRWAMLVRPAMCMQMIGARWLYRVRQCLLFCSREVTQRLKKFLHGNKADKAMQKSLEFS